MKREAYEKQMLELDRMIVTRYWPEMQYEELPGRIEVHLAANLEAAAISTEQPQKTLDALREEILVQENGATLLYLIGWPRIEKSLAIRMDFSSALKKAKRGSELSFALGYAFYRRDLTELAKLHKAGKFRKKIEDLLEDCNFHYECGLLAAKKYDELLSMEKAS